MADYKLPKSESAKTLIRDKKGNDRYLITQKTNDNIYYLYEITDGKLNKLGQGNSPTKLEDKHNVWKNIK